MRHYTEHIIQLFALESKEVESQKEEFFEHLEECYSCKEAYDELTEFYSMLKPTPKLLSEQANAEYETHLTLHRKKLKRRTPRQYVEVSNSVPARVVRFAIRKPVVTTISLFSLVLCFLFFMNFRNVFPKKYYGPDMPTPRVSASSVVYNDKIYLIGGDTRKPGIEGDAKEVEVFDPKKNVWSRASDFPAGGPNNSVVINNKIYSCIFFSMTDSYRSGLLIYDPKNNEWQSFNAPYVRRSGDQNVIAYKEKLYIFGGYAYCQTAVFNIVDMYDTRTKEWKTAYDSIPEPDPKITSQSIARVDNRVYVMGGLIDKLRCGPYSYHDDVLEYNLDTKKWIKKSPMPVKMALAQPAVAGNKIFLIGGFKGTYLNSIWQYDVDKESWSYFKSLPENLKVSTTCIYDNKLYIFGYYETEGNLASKTVIYDIPLEK